MPGYQGFVTLHALFGTIALLTFWSAVWMKKGSPRHRAIGKVFLLAMCGVIASGIPLAVEQAVFRRNLVGGVFLTRKYLPKRRPSPAAGGTVAG